MSAEASEAKKRGNTFFASKEYEKAIKAYSDAIAFEPKGPESHTYFSNRSACFAAINKFNEALSDAEKCLQLKPDFSKGYSRKGFALFKLNKLDEAKSAYQEGLKIEPNNSSLKEGLDECEAAQRSGGAGGAGGAGGGRGLFGPEIWPMIHANPELRAFAADKDFINKVNMLQNSPQMAMQMGLLQDPKIQKLFEVMLGMKMGPEEGDNADVPESENVEAEAKEDHEDEDDAEHGSVVIEGENEKKKEKEADKEKEEEKKKETFSKKEETNKTPEELEQERQEAEEQKKKEEDALRRRREEQQKEKEAEAQKAKGNKFYDAKNFDEAMQCYQKAFEINPKNPAYLLNQSAVLFMQEKWDVCIEKCHEAISLCRQYFCDLKWTFKAFNRMGSVEEKRGNKEKALEYYRKALLEQKDETLKKRVKQMEKEVEQAREKAYLDPEKSQQHKEQGNSYFKQGKWQDAITEYTEAIRRNPKEPLLYSNRATAYCKIMGWGAALKDCETCLKIDPTFIKALIRQGKIYHVLKQYHKSLICYRKAAEIDANNSDLKAARQDTMRAVQERNMSGEVDEATRQRVLEDPDVKSAMNDPEVSSVLLQAQSGDQSILFRAMRDKPRIAEKIELLVAAGVLQMR